MRLPLSQKVQGTAAGPPRPRFDYSANAKAQPPSSIGKKASSPAIVATTSDLKR